jgi:hypothetical protein
MIARMIALLIFDKYLPSYRMSQINENEIEKQGPISMMAKKKTTQFATLY